MSEGTIAVLIASGAMDGEGRVGELDLTAIAMLGGMTVAMVLYAIWLSRR